MKKITNLAASKMVFDAELLDGSKVLSVSLNQSFNAIIMMHLNTDWNRLIHLQILQTILRNMALLEIHDFKYKEFVLRITRVQ